MLLHLQPMSGERLFADVNMVCDLTLQRDRVLCLHPLTLVMEPTLLSSSIYLEWQQVKDVSPPIAGKELQQQEEHEQQEQQEQAQEQQEQAQEQQEQAQEQEQQEQEL